MTYAVIPAKDFNGAKQRLAAFLRPHERRLLARAMLHDTLSACGQARGLSGVGVVTCHPEVAEVAQAFGAEVLWEPRAQGQSEAVSFAVRTCMRRGIDALLTLPGDVPLITAADVEAVLAPTRPAVSVIIVPNRTDSGTNAIVLSPPNCLPLRFGHDSFRRHLHLAAARGLTVSIRRLPRLALDIDEPEDLALFAIQHASGQSWQVLATLGILERLALLRPSASPAVS